TLVISFLARLAGLGKVSDAVVKVVKAVQAKVDKAIDWVINTVVAKAKAFGKAAMGAVKGAIGGKDTRSDDDKKKDLAAALNEATALQNQPKATAKKIKTGLAALKKKYKLTSATLLKVDGKQHIKITLNPEGETKDTPAPFVLNDDAAIK